MPGWRSAWLRRLGAVRPDAGFEIPAGQSQSPWSGKILPTWKMFWAVALSVGSGYRGGAIKESSLLPWRCRSA